MKKQLVFLHQNYPAQFGPISRFLLQHYDVDITFITQFTTQPVYPGIRHIPYQPAQTNHEKNPYFFSRYFEQECASMHGIYNALQQAKIEPDLFIGHTAFGTMGLLHVDYPDVPRIGFFELFYDVTGKQSDNRPEYPAQKPNRLRLPLRNATQLIELEYCSKGYSPTPFQRSTYPERYRDKLSVLFDGINVDHYKPGEISSDTPLKQTWPRNAKVVTYVSRGLEAMRGFDIFMKVAHRVSQIRSDVHFVIAGNPKTHYGSEMSNIKEATFKEHVLKQAPYDLNRFHFLNWISEAALVDLYRLSDCHFYWTVPFTLSWSLLQALSTGCLVLASHSIPVRDIVISNVNGVLVEPYDIDSLTERMLNMLDHPNHYQSLREAARDSMETQFSFDVCLPKLAEFYLNETACNLKTLNFHQLMTVER